LVKEFAGRFSGTDNLSIEPQLIERLQSHYWPGNIRELENLVERMVILRKSDSLTMDDLPQDFVKKATSANTVTTTEYRSLRGAEKELILNALDHCGGNKSKTATYLQIPRHVLVYRMKKYGIF
jgi:two-component system NtrC family response regulator